jgi:hypothetical protein
VTAQVPNRRSTEDDDLRMQRAYHLLYLPSATSRRLAILRRPVALVSMPILSAHEPWTTSVREDRSLDRHLAKDAAAKAHPADAAVLDDGDNDVAIALLQVGHRVATCPSRRNVLLVDR